MLSLLHSGICSEFRALGKTCSKSNLEERIYGSYISPLDALRIASENPGHEIVFFGIGFETTAPIHALTILEAYRKKIRNFSVLTSLFTVPQAITTIAQDKECTLNEYSCRRSCMRHYRNIRI